MKRISILGGGPAGSAAALAALREGARDARVRVIEKSRLPRHKVCGEFFSPEIAPELEKLGVWDAFLAAGPARVRRTVLHFGAKLKSSPLPEAAFGLSRYAFDLMLLDQARAAGADLAEPDDESPLIVATGRRATPTTRGQRLFGFKAHFEGPVDDAVELFFFERCYVGVSCIEDGKTNVCGLAPESFLSRFGFEYDGIVMHCPALFDRLKPLRRVTPWFSTGPLQYAQAFANPGHVCHAYLAGDALSFVDPFTGSGLLAAVRSGAMAGRAAAIGQPVTEYLEECRASLRQPFQVARVLRGALEGGWAERLMPLAPARLLFALTRP
ncbi:MAG TPA: tryptophan 7-halogenase, partial [Bryobacteraceae bacterium]|nr:tryptophan 7-halogenase [Bryobacteraceae bacterium]